MPIPQASPPPPTLHAIRAHQAQQPSPIPIAVAPQQPQHPRDVSSLHPVFFTRRLQRPPLPPSLPPQLLNGVFVSPAAVPGVLNPVAHGYVYRDERHLRGRAGVPML
ncbi:hypothetical protein F5B17DRAFT_1422 [Nemania serpens]|nr:hypothetical protein F5B17DRAFT_1422 [Nemania serpens]